MSEVVSRRQSIITLAVAFALCAAASLSTLRDPFDYLAPVRQTDFKVYYVASDLVREHLDSHLYDGAGTGVDPQLRYAHADNMIAEVARSKGIERIKLYVYSPFLADVLLPFTWLSVTTGAWIWRFWNLLVVVLSAGLLSRLLGFKLLSISSLLVLAGLFCFSPLWQGLYYGQITIVLLALWSAGILLYVQGWKRASALVLSIGVLVKMTPLLILVPILIWRDWRWIRWFAGSMAASFLLMCFKNSPSTVFFYFRRVVPPMSVGIVNRQNKTVLSAVGMLWCNGLNYKGMVVPPHVIMIGKLLSVTLVGIAALLTYRSRKDLQTTDRRLSLAAFALLSLCVSPVAWVDTLIIGYILLALLWKRMLDGGRPFMELLLLFATTIALGTSAAIGSIYWRIDNFFQYAPLILAILLVLYVLDRRGGLGLKDIAD